MKAVFACGGTGGHIFPAIAVAESLREKYGKKAKVLFIGSDTGMEGAIIRKNGFAFEAVKARPVSRKKISANLANMADTVAAVFAAGRIIKKFSPDFVMGTGGFAAFPAVLAAALAGRKTAVHEPNMIPGLANRVLAPFVSVITVGFPETAAYFPAGKTKVTGNPVRKAIEKAGKNRRRGGKNVLVMPGSRAAKSVNSAVLSALPHLKRSVPGIKVLWMTGDAENAMIKKLVRNMKWVKPVKFIENAAAAYASSAAGVLRAGASTLSEITAVGLPSVLVPYPHATANHQEKNARVLEKKGAVVVIKDRSLEPETLARAITEILKPETGRKMSAALKKMYTANGAKNIVNAITGEHNAARS